MPYNVSRVIPVLTVKNRELVKTLKFGNPKYIGDPINAIKVFNDKECDELMVLDIGASVNRKSPDFVHLKEMAGEAFMPIGYGGGIHSFETARQVFQCGIEKVVLNSVLLENPGIVDEIAAHYGNQSVVISLDYKKEFFGGIKPVFFSGKKNKKILITAFAKEMENRGAGEIILHNVDREGTFAGYDLELLQEVVQATTIPVVPLGGAGGHADLDRALESAGAHAVAAASLFVFKNNDRNSILINYSTTK
jgi:cyclase